MPEPKDLSDEELDAAIANPNPEPEEVELPEPDVPAPEPETLEEEPEEVEESEEEEPAEEPKPPSRREQLRIQDILAKRAEQPELPQKQSNAGLDYGTALDADPEVIKQLEDDRRTQIQAAVEQNNRQVESVRWETLLNLDAPQVEAKYPQLDKDSDEFHPALANAISTMYLSTAGYDPQNRTVANSNVRYKDYVESVFELANEIAGEKTQTTAKNIAKQAATTALRPDGSSAAKRLNLNQTPEAMSDEELDAIISQGIPKK